MKQPFSLKAALLVSGFVLFAGLHATAQESKESHPMDRAWVALNVAKLNVQLSLNDEQQAKVKEIDERYMKKYQAYEATTPKPSDTQMENMVAKLMTERDRDMKAVLNAEQYAKWADMRQKGTSELRDDQKEQKEQQKQQELKK
jgi:Spy/CpxP family protein refolding chaperone